MPGMAVVILLPPKDIVIIKVGCISQNPDRKMEGTLGFQTEENLYRKLIIK